MTTGTGDPAIEVLADSQAVASRVADLVADTVQRRPGAALTVPTGTTPLEMFRVLVDRVQRGALDLSKAHLYCLDEYLGVAADHPHSLTGWLERELVVPAGFDRARVHVLPTLAGDPGLAAARFESALTARGGLDLAVLGLGRNGHVAFNEPGSGIDSRTRVVTLASDSIAQATGYWPDGGAVPATAMTMGIATLLESRRLVLVVTGAPKAAILERTLTGPIGSEVPASWLRCAGRRLTVIVDAATMAASAGRPGPTSG